MATPWRRVRLGTQQEAQMVRMVELSFSKQPCRHTSRPAGLWQNELEGA